MLLAALGRRQEGLHGLVTLLLDVGDPCHHVVLGLPESGGGEGEVLGDGRVVLHGPPCARVAVLQPHRRIAKRRHL